VIVGALIFLPLRRRLRALEAAASRIGAGALDVRADDGGRDENAGLAGAFNRMSADLAVCMLADVSHELRTPLTAMRGFLDTLVMPGVTLDAAARARYLETARQEAARLERIVADLLDLARHEHGAATIEPRAVVDLVHREAGEIEVKAHQLANRRFVFDDKRAPPRRFRHGVILVSSRPRWREARLAEAPGSRTQPALEEGSDRF
jgi:two-component system sensor histidine kinase MtrB